MLFRSQGVADLVHCNFPPDETKFTVVPAPVLVIAGCPPTAIVQPPSSIVPAVNVILPAKEIVFLSVVAFTKAVPNLKVALGLLNVILVNELAVAFDVLKLKV